MTEDRAEIVDALKTPLDRDEVIVLLLWHLGDVLNATSLLPALRRRHHRRLSFVTLSECVPILRNHPDIDRIRVLEFPMATRFTMELWDRLRVLHQELFPGHEAIYNLHKPVDLKRMPRHIIEHWAQAIGIDITWRDMRPLFRTVTKFQPNPALGDYIAIGNGGNDPAKRWPDAQWQRLLAWLRSRYPRLRQIQVGAPGDTRVDGVEDLRGRTIEESFWLVHHARLCITNDSFLAHLAGVSGCPTVTIFGPTSPLQFRPLAPDTVLPVGGHDYRTPCSRNLCRLVRGYLPCIAFPSMRRVAAATERALALAGRGNGTEFN